MKNFRKLETFAIILREVLVSMSLAAWVSGVLLGLCILFVLPNLPTYPYHPEYLLEGCRLLVLLLTIASASEVLIRWFDRCDRVYNDPNKSYDNIPSDIVEQDKITENTKQQHQY